MLPFGSLTLGIDMEPLKHSLTLIPPEPPCSNSKKETFCCFPTLIHFVHIYIEKKWMRLCLRLFFDIWLAFCRGIGGAPPTSVFAVTEWAIANEVAIKYEACQTLKLHFEMRKFLTSKEKMIATLVAIGAGFKLD